MDKATILAKIKERGKETRRYLHSPSHVFADELSKKLNDPKHFSLYLKLAERHDHQQLRHILGRVLEDKNAKSKAKLFTYLVNKK